jgi:hypothetical protein
LREVEAATFSDIRLIDDGKVVSLTCRPLLPQGCFLILISVRGWIDPKAIVPLEGLGKLKKYNSSGTRIVDLPACSKCLNQLRYRVPHLSKGTEENHREPYRDSKGAPPE